MEEIYPETGRDIGDICEDLHQMVIDDHTPVTALVNGVRIIMFEEEKVQVPEYDGPR